MGKSTGIKKNPSVGISGLLRRIGNLGALQSMDARDAKRVILANQLTVSYVFISFPYFFIFREIGADTLAWMLLPILVLHLMTLWLNAIGHHLHARLNLALLTSISITAFAFALGRGSGINFLLLPATMNFLILFDWEKERAYLCAGLVINSAMFVGYQSLSFHVGTWYAIPLEIERWVRITMAVAAELGIIVGTLHFLMGNRRTEKALARASENALAGEKIKSRFIANMSHEIRTPLNVIVGMVNLLDKPQQESKRKELLNNIRVSADDLLAILNDVLDLSKIEAGKMKVESIPINLREMADSVLQPYLLEAGRKGLQLSLEMEAGMAGSLYGDPLRLRQILNNLLSNAMKFTVAGKIILRIHKAAGGGSSQRIAFEVQDSGVGIPLEAQKNLFNSFQQADDSTTRNFGGSGLGLAICKHLTEMMGGTICLKSRPGEGSTVGFTLPFALAGESDDSRLQDSEKHARVAGSGPDAGTFDIPKNPAEVRILIVEDHPLNRMVLREMLEALGFKVEEAFDGRQALETLSARSFDLILMDCHMPVMDGFDCANRIRGKEGPQPMIVGVTADAMAETRMKCLRAGMDEVILKPLEETELRRILSPWKTPVPSRIVGRKPDTTATGWVDIPRLGRLVQATGMRDPDNWSKAMNEFQSDARTLGRLLRESVQSGNSKDLREAAHGLKGICLTMGLNRLAEASRRLESSAANGTVSDWSPALADLEAAFEPSLAELQRFANPTAFPGGPRSF